MAAALTPRIASAMSALVTVRELLGHPTRSRLRGIVYSNGGYGYLFLVVVYGVRQRHRALEELAK
jgi:hypothetical protein